HDSGVRVEPRGGEQSPPTRAVYADTLAFVRNGPAHRLEFLLGLALGGDPFRRRQLIPMDAAVLQILPAIPAVLQEGVVRVNDDAERREEKDADGFNLHGAAKPCLTFPQRGVGL